MSNRLQHESSPYLRQHAHNPVDWYPWGEEAMERSRREDKPIFLSIGYSACHWCHVMERESFEDATIAAFLNEHFISIKVDREERPDLDQIYMAGVQLLTGRGGWPMSMFLTPDLQPFFGGTYWPPHASRGMPGFDQVLAAVLDAWRNRRAMAIEQAGLLTQRIARMTAHDEDSGTELQESQLYAAAAAMERAFDPTHGGFGGAPKFPHAVDLQFLLRIHDRRPRESWAHVVRLTLDRMAAGGIYDHLGGGFARYSVDERWLVPHFEKMLYDNGLLALAYIDSFLATGNEDHGRVARETLDYILRDMRDPAGGFHSAEDADSEGEEGLFYVWRPAEVRAVLGEERGARFCEVYDVTEAGNFEGNNILNLPRTIEQTARLRGWPLDELLLELRQSREELLAARGQRVRPGKDDKVLVCWNGLVIDALARAARAFDEPRYLEAALQAARFCHDQLWHDGRLLHSWRAGRASLQAYLDDYAALANALLSLFEASGRAEWLTWSLELIDQMLERFADPAGGALFYTAHDHERLITRAKDLQDGSIPSGNSLAATALARAAHFTGHDRYREVATQIVRAAVGLMEQHPAAAGQMLVAADLLLGPVVEIVAVAPDASPATRQALRHVHQRYLPRAILVPPLAGASAPSALQPLLQDRTPRNGETTFYICQNRTCQEPVTASHAAEQLGPLLR